MDTLKFNRLQTIASEKTQHLGILLRIPEEEAATVLKLGKQLLEQRLPPDKCPGFPKSKDPDDIVKAAEDAVNQGSYLFALTFYEEAVNSYRVQKRLKPYLNTMLKLGVAFQHLEQDKQAKEILQMAYKEAKSFGETKIANKIFEQISPMIPKSPVWPFDESSQKVIGGQYAEETRNEYEISQLLKEAWEKEFPNITPPFNFIFGMVSFQANVASIQNPLNFQQQNLGQSFSLSADTTRLADFDSIIQFIDGTPIEHITMFAERLSRGILVMHKHLNGSFSSSLGSSISSGNVSIQGYINDFETAQLPFSEDLTPIERYQHKDLINAIKLMLEVTIKLDRIDLFPNALNTFYKHYTATRKSQSFKKLVSNLNLKNPSFSSTVQRELVQVIYADAKWRN